MSDPFFFGYGSLVNTRTHDYPETHPATLTGWRRSWRHTKRRPFAYLSVIPDQTNAISGLIARVPDNDWGALDEREVGYARQNLVPDAVVHKRDKPAHVQIYQTHAEGDLTGRAQFPILLSYIDVVVQGFRDVFGEDGVASFFSSTGGLGSGNSE